MIANAWNYLDFRDDIEEFTPRALDMSMVTKYEVDLDTAIRLHGPAFVPVWQNYRDTGTYTGPSYATSLTMYDGVRTILSHYFRRGCQDADYLTWAYACANVMWRRLEFNGPGQPQFYRPSTFTFYPDGLTTLHKLDPNFTGGGADDGYWTSNGEASTIPEVFALLVQHCQYGETGPALIADSDELAREYALTVMYYLDSLRVGNTLPTTSRFDDMVAIIKQQFARWLTYGPDRHGVSTFDYARYYNQDDQRATTGKPAINNLASWMQLGISAQAALRVYNEHPSYQNDRELLDWVVRLVDWFLAFGREPEWAGCYWDRALECRDCADAGPDDFQTDWCVARGQNRNCWTWQIPRSKNPANEGDKQYQVLMPMSWLPIAALALTLGMDKYREELTWSFNAMVSIHPTTFNFNGKQLNQGGWGYYDLLRALVDPNIYSNFSHGALPCT